MDIDGHKRAFKKWVSAILQNTLRHHPTYKPCNAKKDFKAQFRVTLKARRFGRGRSCWPKGH